MERLENYPELIDSDLDFHATREHFGTGSCNTGISEKQIESGERIVYMTQTRETDEPVQLPNGETRRKCENGAVICGYRENPGCLAFFARPKVRIIPKEERYGVLIQLEELSKKDFIEFWD